MRKVKNIFLEQSQDIGEPVSMSSNQLTVYIFIYSWIFAGLLGDVYRFDNNKMIWTNLTKNSLGTIPSAREGHGFIRGPDNKFYVFGGKSNAGENSMIVLLLFQIQIGPILNVLILMLNCCYFLLSQKVMWPVLWVFISQSNNFFFFASCQDY